MFLFSNKLMKMGTQKLRVPALIKNFCIRAMVNVIIALFFILKKKENFTNIIKIPWTKMTSTYTVCTGVIDEEIVEQNLNSSQKIILMAQSLSKVFLDLSKCIKILNEWMNLNILRQLTKLFAIHLNLATTLKNYWSKILLKTIYFLSSYREHCGNLFNTVTGRKMIWISIFFWKCFEFKN